MIEYGDGGQAYEGMLFWDDDATSRRPGVLVSHTIRGRTPFEESKALALAELGYVGFAIDVYGKSEIGSDDLKSRANMEALLADRPELQRRLQLAVSVFLEQPEIDSTAIAAIGYCFGGLCVLDMARTEIPLKGVASFHGLFHPPGNTEGNTVSAKVLALHGWDDPMAQPESVIALADEMTALNADWQIHGYGNTKHAFTNPAANDSDRGTVYDAAADRRSWLAMRNFLHELFE